MLGTEYPSTTMGALYTGERPQGHHGPLVDRSNRNMSICTLFLIIGIFRRHSF
jgi:hypothetical protein